MEDSVKKSVDDLVTKSELLYAKIAEDVIAYGFKIIAALTILIIGFWLANRVTRVASTTLSQQNFDATIRLYLSRILGVVFKIVVVITAAGVVGVETTSFVAVLGAAGLAVGLALQGSLSNFAGGVMILVLRPFQVSDFIISQGEEGRVTAIDIFYTTLVRADNRRVILPNGPLISNVIVNSTAENQRRVEIQVGVAYETDIAKAEAVLLSLAYQHPKVLKEPNPVVGIVAFADSSINLSFRAWCLPEDFVSVQFDLYKQTKTALEGVGINIPFPQREVRLLGEK